MSKQSIILIGFILIGGIVMVGLLAAGYLLFMAGGQEAPSGLFGSADDQQATLWWAFPTQNYDIVRIERSPNGVDGWAEIGSVSSGQSQYADAMLECETTYYYRARGYNSNTGKYSDYSPVASLTTAACVVYVTPTPGETPTEEPTEEACADSIQYVADVTIPDGTVLTGGSSFTKTWRVRNDGSCAWTSGYTLVFVGGSQMGGPSSVAIPRTVEPGEEVDLSVLLVAPSNSGEHRGEWQMRNAQSVVFGKRLWVAITVPAPPTSTPRPTHTPLPTTPPPTKTPKPATHTPKPPAATPTPTGPTIIEWKGEYFNNRDLSGSPVVTRNDKIVVFNWKAGSPDSKVPADDFSARWTRTLDFGAGLYRFKATVDDGVRVWVDNALIIDQWHDSSSQTYAADYAMSAGKHTIKVEYYEHLADARIDFSWSPVVADSYPDWKGQYYDNRTLSGNPVFTRNDQAVNFDWGTGAPMTGLPADGFSVRWTRTLTFDAAKYRFTAKVDDGVRVWVDDKLVIDEWKDGSVREVSGTVKLSSGKHTVRIEYYDLVDQARIKVGWEKVVTPTPTPTATPTATTPAPATIGGTVWADGCAVTGEDPLTSTGDSTGCVVGSDGLYRANGVLDTGESGIAGLAVALRPGTCSAAPQATATTGADSTYKFEGLAAGTYCVTISTGAPNDAILGTGLWTYPDGSGTIIVSVVAGSSALNVNFGWDVIP